MQSKRNKIIINVLLTLVALLMAIGVGNKNTLELIHNMELDIFSDKTMLILVAIGVGINYALSLLINYNVYRVLYKLTQTNITSVSLYFDLVLSLTITNSLLLLINTTGLTNPLILFFLNCLSYFIYIVITLIRGIYAKEPWIKIVKLCGCILIFTLLINGFSLFSNIKSLETLQ